MLPNADNFPTQFPQFTGDVFSPITQLILPAKAPFFVLSSRTLSPNFLSVSILEDYCLYPL
jgi:hypothetical protein